MLAAASSSLSMSSLRSANQSWFTFSVDSALPLPAELAVYAFSGTEAMNQPFEFTIDLVSRSPSQDLTRLLGKEALLTIHDKSGGKRLVHGVIAEFDQGHTANAFTFYRCKLTARLAFLGQVQDQRIFQNMTVPEIIERVLIDNGFTEESFAFQLRETYPKREYCTQYGESTLHFIQRLAEEEALQFFFTYDKLNHCLTFTDAAGGSPIEGNPLVRFYPTSGMAADTAVVSSLLLRHRINSDGSTFREWNFTTPTLDLTGQEREMDMPKAPTPEGMHLEQYHFPHIYQTKDEGARYTAIQLQRQLTFRQWIECSTDIARHQPGSTFTLYEHPRPDVNRTWWIVSVTHRGEQPQVLEHEAPDERGMSYQAQVVAIPSDTRFVPAITHRKVRIDGVQSAIVTGPAKEEVFTDEYGRVKVQFHWDRLGQHNERTTCWIRVADSWAGVNFGFIQVPRIGQEVMVEFMEGDPDRPLITGRTYNAMNMPPWHLPSQKTLSGIQSREFHGGQRNQIVLDDTQGQVQTQLSSDHQLSQLNLGYITRINHGEGRKDFRGEGFELRTDGWGVVRAAKGMFISTDKRQSAQHHQKDVGEALGQLQGGQTQHDSQGQLAFGHNAQEANDQKEIVEALKEQNNQIRGTGKPHGELSQPQMVLSSLAGIAATTPESAHINTGKGVHITAGKHFSFATAKSFLGTALERISLFAYGMGIKIFAAKGKVEIQAQSDALDIIADKVMRLISAQEKIVLAAPKEIELMAGGSYIKVNKDGVDIGTGKKFVVHAASHTYAGPKSATPDDCPLPSGMINDEQFVALDMKGEPYPGIPYQIVEAADESVVLAEGVTDIQGLTPRIYSIQKKDIKVIWRLGFVDIHPE